MTANDQPLIDFEDGVDLSVGGEITKDNTLPVKYLISLSASLQKLVETVAETDLVNASLIDLNEFQLELVAFNPGSAIPRFQFVPIHQTQIGNDVAKQRKKVSQRVDALIDQIGTGNYEAIRIAYPDPGRRNRIVSSLYEFTNSTGEAPLSIVKFKGQGTVEPIRMVRKLPSLTRDSLLTKIIPAEDIVYEETVVRQGKFRSGKSRKSFKYLAQVKGGNVNMARQLTYVESQHGIYQFNDALVCIVEKEDNYYLFTSPTLHLVGTGITEKEAQLDFSREFHEAYQRYMELSDDQLSARLLRVKQYMNTLVKIYQDAHS